jgi:hypothetical protein
VAAARAGNVQGELRKVAVEDTDTAVPPAVDAQMRELKDELSRAADAALACAAPDTNPVELQALLAKALHANPPQPRGESVQDNDPRYAEYLGSYGHNLQVSVSRPSSVSGLITVQFSVNIECGSDTMLLVYVLRDGAWKRQLRWQANKLSEVSDAFGDFFLTAFLPGREGSWRVVVAHGTPWFMSRFSSFSINVLAPGTDADSARVLWETERCYSRGDFEPTLKTADNIFELRLNADAMEFEPDNGYERRVIYRYQVTDKGVERVGPIAVHARGFVEEWLSAPWGESRSLTAQESDTDLEKVHKEFNKPIKPDDKQFLSYSSGPVLACSAPGVFQVQINTTLETIVPGKPGGDSKPLPSHYFHVREGKDGYVMVSAPTKPDPACAGPDLMKSAKN